MRGKKKLKYTYGSHLEIIVKINKLLANYKNEKG